MTVVVTMCVRHLFFVLKKHITSDREIKEACLAKRNPDGSLDTAVYNEPSNVGRYPDFLS